MAASAQSSSVLNQHMATMWYSTAHDLREKSRHTGCSLMRVTYEHHAAAAQKNAAALSLADRQMRGLEA